MLKTQINKEQDNHIFHGYCRIGYIKGIQEELNNGIDINILDKFYIVFILMKFYFYISGNNCLYIAVTYKYYNIVLYLIEKGININYINKSFLNFFLLIIKQHYIIV